MHEMGSQSSFIEVKFHFDTLDFVIWNSDPCTYICSGMNPLRSREVQKTRRAACSWAREHCSPPRAHEATSRGGARSCSQGPRISSWNVLRPVPSNLSCWGGCHSNSLDSSWQSDSSHALWKVCRATINTRPEAVASSSHSLKCPRY